MLQGLYKASTIADKSLTFLRLYLKNYFVSMFLGYSKPCNPRKANSDEEKWKLSTFQLQ